MYNHKFNVMKQSVLLFVYMHVCVWKLVDWAKASLCSLCYTALYVLESECRDVFLKDRETFL